MIFDTHAHYDDEAFDSDREELLSSIHENGVLGVVNASADINSSFSSVKLSQQYSYIFAAVGVHPENLENLSEDYIEQIKKIATENKKVVAIGEIGLDYHFRSDNKEKQIEVFENQVKLANSLSLPVIVHDREAHKDTFDILKKYIPKGIVHCFSGSAEMAKEIVKLGMKLGIGGGLTFKNAKTVVEVVRQIPLKHLVLETDAPYLAPVPFRGKRCNSSYIKFVAEKIAEIKNISAEEVYEETFKNALEVYNIKEEL